jgi:hypothetical protein
MNKEIYKKLQDVARNKQLITYHEIAPMANLNMELQKDRTEIGRILEGISRYEHDNGRPMLSAVVVHSHDQQPGTGFYNLARDLGLLHSSSEDKKLIFFSTELKKVYETWEGNN